MGGASSLDSSPISRLWTSTNKYVDLWGWLRDDAVIGASCPTEQEGIHVANTTRTREVEAVWAARPEVDPGNIDDAYYILAHPGDFSPDELAAARDTWDAELCAYAERNHP